MRSQEAEELGLTEEYGLEALGATADREDEVAHRRELRRHYVRLRAYFKRRPSAYADLQRRSEGG